MRGNFQGRARCTAHRRLRRVGGCPVGHVEPQAVVVEGHGDEPRGGGHAAVAPLLHRVSRQRPHGARAPVGHEQKAGQQIKEAAHGPGVRRLVAREEEARAQQPRRLRQLQRADGGGGARGGGARGDGGIEGENRDEVDEQPFLGVCVVHLPPVGHHRAARARDDGAQPDSHIHPGIKARAREAIAATRSEKSEEQRARTGSPAPCPSWPACSGSSCPAC